MGHGGYTIGKLVFKTFLIGDERRGFTFWVGNFYPLLVDKNQTNSYAVYTPKSAFTIPVKCLSFLFALKGSMQGSHGSTVSPCINAGPQYYQTNNCPLLVCIQCTVLICYMDLLVLCIDLL